MTKFAGNAGCAGVCSRAYARRESVKNERQRSFYTFRPGGSAEMPPLITRPIRTDAS
jgi:hypothetical protein